MEEQNTSSLLEKLAVNLFSFMRQAGLKVNFGKTDGLTYGYELCDLTEDAQILAAKYELNLGTLSKYDIQDNPESVEKFCYAVTLDLGCQIMKAKCSRLLQHDSKTSSLIIPG
jgi:hypothetical protein